MNILLLITILLSGLLAVRMLTEYKRHPSWRLLAWVLAAFGLAVGSICQWLATLLGDSTMLYRLSLLTGGLLTAAFLGQGAVYLLLPRKIAHVISGILLAALVIAGFVVLTAPVVRSSNEAQTIFGQAAVPAGFKTYVWVFNLFGLVTLLGGALINFFLWAWNGGTPARAVTLGAIGLGVISLGFGGQVLPIQANTAETMAKLIGVVLLGAGFVISRLHFDFKALTEDRVVSRRQKVKRIAVFSGMAILMGAVASLPVIPWLMGIVTNVKSSYISQLPNENRGAYLMTDQGIMELYPWYVEPDDFPVDAPSLKAINVHTIGIIQKQFDVPDNYQLFNLDTETQVRWRSFQEENGRLILDPGTLDPGKYELIVPEDSMFGGQTEDFFQLQ